MHLLGADHIERAFALRAPFLNKLLTAAIVLRAAYALCAP